MGRPTELTKEYLMKVGITDVTEDGTVYCGKSVRRASVTVKKSRFGESSYKIIPVYDPEVYAKQMAKAKAEGKKLSRVPGQKMLVLSRVIWAWYHGSCPADMDVDHIDNDSLHDELSNYQLLTRKENLAKRAYSANQ